MGFGEVMPTVSAMTILDFLDLWSDFATSVQLTDVAGDKALPSITIASIPTGVTIERVIMMLKYRNVENTNAVNNSISGAQNIQAKKAVGGAWIDAINFAGGEILVVALNKENGDVLIGDNDIKAQLPTNGSVMNFQWTSALASKSALNFYDVQVGIRIYFSKSS